MNDIVYGGGCDMHEYCICFTNGGTNGCVIETSNCSQRDYIDVAILGSVNRNLLTITNLIT